MLTPIRRTVKRREPTPQKDPETPSKRIRLEPLTPPSTPSVYSAAKEVFQRGSRARQFYGRKKELDVIKKFIKTSLETVAGALYVSGVPGTGKSAMVARVFEQQKCVKASINCMSVERPEQIYQTILQAFGYSAPANKQKSLDHLENLLTQPDSPPHLLVLDEVDHIVNGDQETMFRLFEWSCRADVKLVLIGIANSLDLADRFLPRLRTNELAPEVLAVKPYSQREIEAILTHQLESADNLIEPEVISLFAAKIAAQSGDLRRAFDLCGRALQLVEQEWRLKPDHATVAPHAASMKHAIEVCQEAFGGNSSIARIRQLNHVQLCCLVVVLIEEQRKTKASLSIHDLWVMYGAFVTREPSWTSLGLEEFIQVMAALEAYSLISITGVCGRRSRAFGAADSAAYSRRRVRIAVQQMDALTAISKEGVKRVLLENL